jgi:hypothetical protein
MVATLQLPPVILHSEGTHEFEILVDGKPTGTVELHRVLRDGTPKGAHLPVEAHVVHACTSPYAGIRRPSLSSLRATTAGFGDRTGVSRIRVHPAEAS